MDWKTCVQAEIKISFLFLGTDLVSVARFLLLVFSYSDLLLVVPDQYQL